MDDQKKRNISIGYGGGIPGFTESFYSVNIPEKIYKEMKDVVPAESLYRDLESTEVDDWTDVDGPFNIVTFNINHLSKIAERLGVMEGMFGYRTDLAEDQFRSRNDVFSDLENAKQAGSQLTEIMQKYEDNIFFMFMWPGFAAGRAIRRSGAKDVLGDWGRWSKRKSKMHWIIDGESMIRQCFQGRI